MTLIESQCYGFDMLEYLRGLIACVTSEMTDNEFLSFALALRFASGSLGTMVCGYASSFRYQPTRLLEINGTNGHVLVDTARRYFFQPVGETTCTVSEPGYKDDWSRSFHSTVNTYLDAAIEAFKRSDPPLLPPYCGHRVLQLALASIQAFKTGQRVDVSP